MDNEQYNAYIKNYLQNDKTKSAIMLTAHWGLGKSYYIQNSLIPYLEESDHKCVVISLYGLKDVKEISKAIYLEMHTKNIYVKNETVEKGKIIGKTILKGVLSKTGIDISLKEEDLERLYASIDLTNKLVVLEDLERSSICINEVLGYVNNLVEQDGAKVLLVANENELIKREKVTTKDDNGNEKTTSIYTKETEEYLKIKEKTVSDTILYICDYDSSLENISKLYIESKIAPIFKEKTKKGTPIIINTIRDVMVDIGNYNLRSFIFACQKTADMFSYYPEQLNNEFMKHVFLGIVAFSLRLKQNDDLKWDEKASPNKLGTSKYPLYDFCKDYIKYQEVNIAAIQSSEKLFIETKEYEQKQREIKSALDVLYDFPTQESLLLTAAISDIRDELKSGNTIPLAQYKKLASYLIATKNLIDSPEIVDECKSAMLNNIENSTGITNELIENMKFFSNLNFWNDEQKEEYKQFMDDLLSALQEKLSPNFGNKQPVNFLEAITDFMLNNETNVRKGPAFLQNIDIDKLVDGLEKATAKQVSNFRRCLLSNYNFVNIRDLLPNDEDALRTLKTKTQQLLDNDKGADKVVRLQYIWLLDNIDSILENY